MKFSDEQPNWKDIISSEILGPFASRSGWIWDHKTQVPASNIIKSDQGKIGSKNMQTFIGSLFIAKMLKHKNENSKDLDRSRESVLANGSKRKGLLYPVKKKKSFNPNNPQIRKLLEYHRKQQAERHLLNNSEFIILSNPILDNELDFERLPRCKTAIFPSKADRAYFYI